MSDTISVENPYGFDKMTKVELRKRIADLVSSVIDLQNDKKEWVTAANEAIKETNLQIKKAVEALKEVEKTGMDGALEKRTTEFLRSMPTL